MNPPSTGQNLPLTLAVVKALAYNENGGKPNLNNLQAGKSGEMKSIFQYTPATWKAVAGKFLGNTDAPLTTENETAATTARVNKWLEQGYTPEQIFSMQNAGPGEPDAYTGKFSDGSSSSGTNKYGVKYNVKGYVDNGMKYLSEFEPDITQKIGSAQGTPLANTPAPQQAQTPVVPPVNPSMSSMPQTPGPVAAGPISPTPGPAQLPGMLVKPATQNA